MDRNRVQRAGYSVALHEERMKSAGDAAMARVRAEMEKRARRTMWLCIVILV